LELKQHFYLAEGEEHAEPNLLEQCLLAVFFHQVKLFWNTLKVW